MARGSDGDIIITTGLDNSKLAKELDDLETKLEKQKIDLKITNIDYESATRQLENTEKELQRNKQKEEEIKGQLQEQLNLREQLRAEGKDTSGVTQRITSLYQELSPITDETIRLTENWNRQYDVVDKIEQKMQKQNADIQETEGKINRVKLAIQQIGRIDWSKTIKNMSKNLEKVTKKVSRMGLTLLGVRSIYGMISSAMNRLKEENPQLASVMQTIQNAFDIIAGRLIAEILPTIREILPTLIQVANIILNVAVTLIRFLIPVIKFIIQALSWIVNFIGGLLRDLLGIDIATNNFAKGLDKSNKKAKALRKQLMGFDEMNILNKDTGTTGAIGGLSGIGEQIGNIDDNLPNWIKHPSDTLIKIGQGIVDTIRTKLLFLGGGGGYILWTLLFGEGNNGPTNTQKAVTKFLRKVNSQLLGAKAKYKDGLVEVKTTNGEIIHYTEQEFNELMNELGYTTDKKTGEIKKIVLTTNVDIEKSLKENANNIEKGWLGVSLGISNTGNNLETNLKQNADHIEKSWLGAGFNIEGKYTGTNGFVNKVKSAFGLLPQTGEEKAKATVDAITGVINGYSPFEVNINTTTNAKETVKTITSVVDNYEPPNIVVNAKATIEAIINKQKLVSSVVTAIKGVTIPLSFGVTSAGASGLKAIFGAKGLMLNAPKLASGGIINKPGRGVPLAVGGIAGERGREAVVPLTDTQQMQYLGREIGKNVVINFTGIMDVDGKQLARTTAQVMNEMNFASNGGVI